jgi:hypothetical protein
MRGLSVSLLGSRRLWIALCTDEQSLCVCVGFFLSLVYVEFDLLIDVVRAVKIHSNMEAF